MKGNGVIGVAKEQFYVYPAVLFTQVYVCMRAYLYGTLKAGFLEITRSRGIGEKAIVLTFFL